MTKSVLITGLDGFTGKFVADELRRRGHTVFGTVRGAATDIAGAITCDLLDSGRLQSVIDQTRPDWVVHLAAIAFVGHGNAAEMYATNVVGTRNLLECLSHADQRPTAVLLASSANVYGNTSSPAPLTEDTPFSPANDYAVSKVAMEYAARLWQDRLPITTVRPFNYIGVGQSPNFLVAKIADHFKRREAKIELGNLDVARDFSDVRWVAQSYCDLLEKSPAGEIFNICSGRAVTLEDLLDIMGRIAGYQIDVEINPAFVRSSEVKYLCGDPKKLESLAHAVKRPTLEDTLSWLLNPLDSK